MWFFATMLEALDSVLRDADLDVLLYQIGDAAGRHAFFEQLPVRRKADAVVVLGFPVSDAEQRRLELTGVKIVAAGGQSAAYPYVSIDDEVAGRQAIDHLISLGHQRIAMIAGGEPDGTAWSSAAGRSQAYYSALREAGIAADPSLVKTARWLGRQGADAMGELLGVRELPTAVFAHSDEIAVGAMSTLRRAGLRVPEDISVIGIDDQPLAELADLTTVSQPVYQQGQLAGQMVLRLLQGEDVEQAITVPTRLVIRRSTVPPGAKPVVASLLASARPPSHAQTAMAADLRRS